MGKYSNTSSSVFSQREKGKGPGEGKSKAKLRVWACGFVWWSIGVEVG